MTRSPFAFVVTLLLVRSVKIGISVFDHHRWAQPQIDVGDEFKNRALTLGRLTRISLCFPIRHQHQSGGTPFISSKTHVRSLH